MNDDAAEKHFDATPSRRERAKRDGRSARSQEAAGVASFAAALAGLALSLPLLGAAAAVAFRASATTLPALGVVQALAVLALAFVPALCAAFGATFATLAQTGGLHVAPIALGFDKLAPWPGLKRMFGAEAAVGAARATIAFAVVVAIVVPLTMHAVVAASASESLAATAGIVRDAALQACVAAAVTGAAFALLDYGLVRRRWLRSLKMTFDEFKRDAKEQDGDPHAKSRRRSLHRSLVRGGVARTREASFVIANPTHIAIAIRYAPPAVPVPEIVVRAADSLALEVRAIAERAGIPIVADVALARLLWRTGETGRPIPAETFVAVATAIAALIRAGVLAR
jgi:flagellar biosynthetic protein FlhB